MNHKPIILINFWGLGDLIASLHIIKKRPANHYILLTVHESLTVNSLISSLYISSDVKIVSVKNKFFVFFVLTKMIIKKNLLVFTSPLAGNSRKLANFLSLFTKNIILAKEHGNIYKNNESIIKLLK